MYHKPINYGMIITVGDSDEVLFKMTLITSDKEAAEDFKDLVLEQGLLRCAFAAAGIPKDYIEELKFDVQVVPFKNKFVDVSELSYSSF